jgi:hypothetical protein
MKQWNFVKMVNKEQKESREGPLEREAILQPLREVGTIAKTKSWTFDDIEGAIREANLRGIDPQQLFGTSVNSY